MTIRLLTGEMDAAVSMAAEAEAIARATDNPVGPYGPMLLAAWQGRDAETFQLIAGAIREMATRGEGQWLTTAHWATAVLCNGLGRYDEALAAAEQGSAYPDELGLATWSMAELIEAAEEREDASLAATRVLSAGGDRPTVAMDVAADSSWRFGSRRVQLLGAAVAVAVAALVLALTLLGGDGVSVSDPIPIGKGPLRVAAGDAEVWATSAPDGTLNCFKLLIGCVCVHAGSRQKAVAFVRLFTGVGSAEISVT